jgi:hypothetical protein
LLKKQQQKTQTNNYTYYEHTLMEAGSFYLKDPDGRDEKGKQLSYCTLFFLSSI